MKTSVYFSLAIYLVVGCSGNNRKGGIDSITQKDDSTGRVFALIIGVSEYDDDQIGALNYAHKDADAFTNFLLQQVGNNGAAAIQLLKNEHASKAKIMSQIDWLYKNVKKDDQVYFYFSGHGMVHGNESAFSGAYLCAHDTYKANLFDGGLDMNLVVNTLNKFVTEKEARVYFIADACRAGLAQKSYSTKIMEVASADGKSPEMIRFLSCGENQESLESVKWGGGRGLFSYYLELGLSGEADSDQNKAISVHELEMYLKQIVPTESQKEGGLQIPEVLGNKIQYFNTNPTDASAIKGPPMDCGTAMKASIDQMISRYLNLPGVKEPGDFFDPRLRELTEDLDSSQNCNPELVLLEGLRSSNNELFHQYTFGKVINTGSDRFLKAAKLAKYARDKYKQHTTAPILLELLQEHYYFFMAKSYTRSTSAQQQELAFHYLDLLQDERPSCSTYVYHLYALAHHHKGDLKKAKRYYRRAMAHNPDWVFPWVNLAGIYHIEGNKKSTLALLDSALAIDGRFASAFYMKGLLHQDDNQFAGAELAYRKALKLNAEHYGAANNLARVLEQKGFDLHRNEIIHLYEQAIRADSHYLDAWCNLGRVYILSDSVDRAIELLNEALWYNDYQGDIEMQATTASVYDYLAWASEKKGDLKGAETYLHKSVQLSDGSAGTYAYLLVNLLDQDEKATALSIYEKALQKHRTKDFLSHWAKESSGLKSFLQSNEVKEVNDRVLGR